MAKAKPEFTPAERAAARRLSGRSPKRPINMALPASGPVPGPNDITKPETQGDIDLESLIASINKLLSAIDPNVELPAATPQQFATIVQITVDNLVGEVADADASGTLDSRFPNVATLRSDSEPAMEAVMMALKSGRKVHPMMLSMAQDMAKVRKSIGQVQQKLTDERRGFTEADRAAAKEPRAIRDRLVKNAEDEATRKATEDGTGVSKAEQREIDQVRRDTFRKATTQANGGRQSFSEKDVTEAAAQTASAQLDALHASGKVGQDMVNALGQNIQVMQQFKANQEEHSQQIDQLMKIVGAMTSGSRQRAQAGAKKF